MKKFLIYCLLGCFLSVVKGGEVSSHTLLLEGTVVASSKLPDPAKNDYADCNYAIKLKIYAVQPIGTPIDREIMLIIPIMRNFKLLPANILNVNDKIEVSAGLYDNQPETVRQIQVADSLQELDLVYYYTESAKKVIRFKSAPAMHFEKVTRTPAVIATLPPASLEEKQARAQAIATDLAQVNHWIAAEGSVDSWAQRLQIAVMQNNAAKKRGDRRWIGDSFFAASSVAIPLQSVKPEKQIPELLKYQNFLKQLNIDMILLRIPTKGDIAFDLFSDGKTPHPNPRWVELLRNLLENDIEVVDPTLAMLDGRKRFPLMYFYQVAAEGHPFEGASRIAAEQLAKRLARYHFNDVPKGSYSLVESSYSPNLSFPRNYYPPGNPKFSPQQPLRYSVVRTQDGYPVVLSEDTPSPILMVSNSFGAYPSRPDGGSIPHYLTYLTGIKPAWMYRDGIEEGIFRMMVQKPELLAQRRVVIIVMHPNTWGRELSPLPENISKSYSLIPIKKYLLNPPDSSIVWEPEDVFVPANSGLLIYPKDGKPKGDGGILTLPSVPVESAKTVLVRMAIARHNYLRIHVSIGQHKDFQALTGIPRVTLEFMVNNDGTPIHIFFQGGVERKNPPVIESIELFAID